MDINYLDYFDDGLNNDWLEELIHVPKQYLRAI